MVELGGTLPDHKTNERADGERRDDKSEAYRPSSELLYLVGRLDHCEIIRQSAEALVRARSEGAVEWLAWPSEAWRWDSHAVPWAV